MRLLYMLCIYSVSKLLLCGKICVFISHGLLYGAIFKTHSFQIFHAKLLRYKFLSKLICKCLLVASADTTLDDIRIVCGGGNQ